MFRHIQIRRSFLAAAAMTTAALPAGAQARPFFDPSPVHTSPPARVATVVQAPKRPVRQVFSGTTQALARPGRSCSSARAPGRQ